MILLRDVVQELEVQLLIYLNTSLILKISETIMSDLASTAHA